MQYLRLLLTVAITLCAGVFSIRAEDTPQQAAARAALMQQMNATDTGSQAPANEPPPQPAPPTFHEKQATPPPAPAPVPEQQMTPPPAPAPAPEPMTTLPPTAQVSTNIIVPPVEQESVPLPTNTMTQYPVNPAPAAPPVATPPPMAPAPQETPAAAAPSMATPPPPISADQQQQLQQLLSKYMANQITPAQYQVERAAILKGQ